MRRTRLFPVLVLVFLAACGSDAMPASATEPPPFTGLLVDLLSDPRPHLGAQVQVTGTIGRVAEGGPMLTLRDAGGGEVVVLIDPPDDEYAINYVPGEQAEVTGVLLEMTAENIDSAESPHLEGAAVMRYWSGPRYLIITSEGPIT